MGSPSANAGGCSASVAAPPKTPHLTRDPTSDRGSRDRLGRGRVARVRAREDEQPSGPVAETGFVGRNARLARLGARTSGGFAVHRARRVFASAERRETLDRAYEIRTAEQVGDGAREHEGRPHEARPDGQLSGRWPARALPGRAGPAAARRAADERGARGLDDRAGAGPSSRGALRRMGPGSDRRRIDRSGAPGDHPRRRRGGGEGAVPGHRRRRSKRTSATSGLLVRRARPGVPRARVRSARRRAARPTARGARLRARGATTNSASPTTTTGTRSSTSPPCCPGTRRAASSPPSSPRGCGSPRRRRGPRRNVISRRRRSSGSSSAACTASGSSTVTRIRATTCSARADGSRFSTSGSSPRSATPELVSLRALIETMVLEPDPGAFRHAVEQAGFLKPGAPVSDAQVVDYFGHFYEYLQQDRRLDDRPRPRLGERPSGIRRDGPVPRRDAPRERPAARS